MYAWLKLYFAASCLRLPVSGDQLSVVSYNVREPNGFSTTVNGTRRKYSLLDSDYTGNTANGYMSGGKGKLTDGLFGQSELPLDVDVTATESNWLAWVFKAKDPNRLLNVYFKFEEDMLIDSISINVLSQKFNDDVSTYIYSTLLVRLLQADNATVVRERVSATQHPKDPGIHTIPILINSCEPVPVVRMDFEANQTRRLVLGEVQFDGESAIQIKIDTDKERNFVDPGRRFTLTCLSNKPSITLVFRGVNLNCKVTKSTDNQYNCTVVKQRFGFSDIGKYNCSVTPFNRRCQSKSKSITVFGYPGIYADVLEREVHLSSVATLSCHTESFTADIGFQKIIDGGTAVDITNSSNHILLIENNGVISKTTLTLLNFTQADVGVYICKARRHNGEVVYSQEMTVFLVNGSTSTSGQLTVPTTLQSDTLHSEGSPGPGIRTTMSHEIFSSAQTSSVTVVEGSSGLGGGALGGIIGAAVLVFIISVVAVYLFWHCHQRAERNVRSSVNDNSDGLGESFTLTCTDSRAYGVLHSSVEENKHLSDRRIPTNQLSGSEEQPNSEDDPAYETPRDTRMIQFTTSTAYVSQSDAQAAQRIAEPV